MMLTELATVLKAAGLPVVETPGWRGRGHGPMTSVEGVTCHHTASGRGTGTTLGLSTVRDGRPGLEGPLAHLYLNRAGVFYVVAAGLCYHAGVSQHRDQENAHRIGIEALAAGDGWDQDWPPAQMRAYALGCRALADHYEFPVANVMGHKETCSPRGRKVDPTFDMAQFRRMVATVSAEAREDEDMKSTDQVVLTEAAARNMSVPGYTVRKAKEKLSLSYIWQWGGPGLYRVLAQVIGVRAEVKALTTKVDELSAKLDAVLALQPKNKA